MRVREPPADQRIWRSGGSADQADGGSGRLSGGMVPAIKLMQAPISGTSPAEVSVKPEARSKLKARCSKNAIDYEARGGKGTLCLPP